MGGGHKRNTENGMCCCAHTKVNDPSDQISYSLSLLTIPITGLFDTITSTSKSKDCPGRCVHVLAALLCEKVMHFVKRNHQCINLLNLFISLNRNPGVGQCYLLGSVHEVLCREPTFATCTVRHHQTAQLRWFQCCHVFGRCLHFHGHDRPSMLNLDQLAHPGS